MRTIRPKINMEEEVYNALQEWADEQGFRMHRAWHEIVKIGLESEDAINN